MILPFLSRTRPRRSGPRISIRISGARINMRIET